MNRKVFYVIGNILIYFVVLGLLGSSFAKLMGEKGSVLDLYNINFDNPIYVGLLELLCAFLLGFPPTRRIGLFMSTAFLGGVIVADVVLQRAMNSGILLTSILWIGAFLRDPQLFGFPDIYKKD